MYFFAEGVWKVFVLENVVFALKAAFYQVVGEVHEQCEALGDDTCCQYYSRWIDLGPVEFNLLLFDGLIEEEVAEPAEDAAVEAR